MAAHCDSAADSRHLIDVKVSPEKGLGLFANADIPRGTRIIAEPALLGKNADYTAKDVMKEFRSLSPTQQSRYLELHGYLSEDIKSQFEQELGNKMQKLSAQHRKVLAIYAANANGRIIYLHGSIFNHSCIPNVHYEHNSNLGMETFHAIHDIAAGEELTITYIHGTYRTRNQRQAKLAKWGFLCTCPACVDTPAASKADLKRAQMFDLDKLIAAEYLFRDWESVRKSAQKMAALQRSVGLIGRDLSKAYAKVAWACYQLGDRRMELLWGTKVLDIDLFCLGPDNPHCVWLAGQVVDIVKAIRKEEAQETAPEPTSKESLDAAKQGS
ncbi:hypothetical protein SLS60_011895 [Paraconiothyrium brasiliense]|uniref:SET domain-containing protein n=1 Tax=Paraconiothyrium brasiliense TaxID=300254 RepID=A0ABR3QH82_9PLEO